jgi:hypothetical protein
MGQAKQLENDRRLRYAFFMIDEALITRVKDLSAAERLELLGAVWETLASED